MREVDAVQNGVVQNEDVSIPATGLGWPVSRETESADPRGVVSRETSTGLGWPERPTALPQLEDDSQ